MGQVAPDIPRSIHGSTFYTVVDDPSDIDRSRAYSAGAQTVGSDPTQKRQGYPGRTASADASSSNLAVLYAEIRDEIRDLRDKQSTALETIGALKTQMQNEYSYYHNVLHEERFRYQRLEEQLNDTIELHQAEIVNLKTDMQGIANRMEYQYMNRFRDLQEIVEASQNRMLQLEQKMASEVLGGVAG
uniref:Uncharacterized protein n=1 Tax=Plectus sambesii TaxID=2011161 RepID=A0A914UY52_9BILA